MTYDQTHWIPEQRRQPLPTFYYHSHFTEMLDFVASHYAHTLLDEHIRFIDEFRTLSRNAQCLYVRLINRKGRVFGCNRLRYPELGNPAPLLDELRHAEWVAGPGTDDFDVVLTYLTRAEIYAVALPLVPGMSRSLKKAPLVRFVRDNIDARKFMDALDTDRILVQLRADAVRYLLFLYFGRIRDSLSQFTMRDLGLVRTQNLQDSYEPRFTDRVEALEHYYFASRLHSAADADARACLEREAGEWPEPNFPGSARLRDELAFTLGRAAERARATDKALSLYVRGESAKCSERIARLFLASGKRDEAQQFLERCIDNPRSEEERLVAEDIYARKFDKKRTSTATDALRAGESLSLDESRSGAPERAAVEHFEGLGFAAYRTENLVWRTLFGLLFWDELFVGDDTSLHSPFEFLPAALANGQFYEQNRERVEHKLALLRQPAAAKRELLRIGTQYYGTPNGVFRWRRELNDAVFALVDYADSDALTHSMRRLCTDYRDSRYGYPDIMVIDEQGVRFLEVKTEGDQLRRNQLLRLEQLRSDGFRADVLRVHWTLDPNQAYVVVDVETTGGKGENHRVTEIGAVKVRNGEVVDRFQTLLNPQRTIPPNIVRLTGITPAMVEDAPYFMDIADDFAEFMGDAIFVAHNVEFDYGFISREFARLGRSFRHAKLCTCSSMRKLYPGHRSYSLASLCQQYEIPLRQHHRALSDAEAAAELLLLINEKRRAACES
ncbi:MAG: exonuclease domain-containing protein [Woeseiaceae bacterium]|nr:exonuclease domain-containing protein [Woeseiaceae bacterium]